MVIELAVSKVGTTTVVFFDPGAKSIAIISALMSKVVINKVCLQVKRQSVVATSELCIGTGRHLTLLEILSSMVPATARHRLI